MAELVHPTEAARAFAASGLAERMGPKNLLARRAADAAAYKEQYGRGMLDWGAVSPGVAAGVVDAARAAKRACAEAGYAALARMPWRIALSGDASVENGYPHTVGDFMVIPLRAITSGAFGDLGQLLVHEAVHVAQRRDPEGAYRLVVGEWGFERVTDAAAVDGLGEARVNPDTDGLVYGLEGKLCHPVFSKASPSSLADVSLRPDGAYPRFEGLARNHEHPFEIMAELIASSVKESITRRSCL